MVQYGWTLDSPIDDREYIGPDETVKMYRVIVTWLVLSRYSVGIIFRDSLFCHVAQIFCHVTRGFELVTRGFDHMILYRCVIVYIYVAAR